MRKFETNEWKTGFQSYSLQDLKIADPDYSFDGNYELNINSDIKDCDSEYCKIRNTRIDTLSTHFIVFVSNICSESFCKYF